jgi:site-specific recombinase XerD
VRVLIQACSATAPTGIRNRALLVVLYRGGLRLGEALALAPKDLDPARGTVRVLHGKGDRARTVGLDPGALAVVERGWRNARSWGSRPGGSTPTGSATPTPPNSPKKAIPINLVQAQLGHSSLATTDRYLRHIAPATLAETMRRRE